MSRDRARLAVAADMGFRTVEADALSDATPAGGFDVVADCSGAAPGIDAGLRATRKGGHYVQIGLAGRPIQFAIDLVCLNELKVTSGFASTPRSWKRLEALVAAGHVQLEPLVSEAFSLSRWEEAFARTRAADGLKLVIDPRMA
jgi:L-iditol 2-dehydrogenase